MEDLTFGEQVKIVLGRKGMTIKELAETIEKETGKKMSRQNLTQRLGRDNFQEQDMRLIASILGCPFQLSIMSGEITESAAGRIRKQEIKWNEQEQPEESFSEETVETEKEEQQLTGEERDMTIGEIYDMHYFFLYRLFVCCLFLHRLYRLCLIGCNFCFFIWFCFFLYRLSIIFCIGNFWFRRFFFFLI